jgi:hypothetical protein
MSKIALSGDASGTGTFTIASPNSNSNFTLTLPTESGTVLTGSTTTGFKNRLINGEMDIDQRNAGASVTPTASEYTLDRWQMDIGLASKFSVQQVSDAPSGFINSVRLTVVSSYTPAAGNAMFFRQSVEGLNVSDFAWGAASAQSISVSFWVKSSVTGTYSVSIGNSANNYHYIATYTVSSASTWEYKTISIPGPTAGTWLTTNGAGLRLKFDIGSGSNFNGTANVWSAADVGRTSGSVVLGSNSGATWQITGVQLEKGSQATSFDFRDYGRELALCQRYYEALSANANSAPGAGAFFTLGVAESTSRVQPYYSFKVQKRTSPSTTLSAIGNFGMRSAGGSSVVCTSGAFGAPTAAYAQGEFNCGSNPMTSGGCGWLTNHTGSATIEWSAEL